MDTPARTSMLQLSADTGCSLEDLPGAETEEQREAEKRERKKEPKKYVLSKRHSDIYIYIYIYIYYIYIYILYISLGIQHRLKSVCLRLWVGWLIRFMAHQSLLGNLMPKSDFFTAILGLHLTNKNKYL